MHFIEAMVYMSIRAMCRCVDCDVVGPDCGLGPTLTHHMHVRSRSFFRSARLLRTEDCSYLTNMEKMLWHIRPSYKLTLIIKMASGSERGDIEIP